MNTAVNRTGFALLMLVVVTAGFEVCPAAGPLPAGSVSGIAVGPDGKPLDGALVSIDDHDYHTGQFNPILRTASAKDGSFHLGPLDAVYQCPYDLRIAARGLAAQVVAAQTFSVYSGADNDLGTIRVDRGQIVAGQVLDADGSPRRGAIVECEARRYFSGCLASAVTPRYRLTTDAQGRFVTPRLPVSFAGFTVRVAGRLMPWICVPIAPDGVVRMPPIHLRKAAPIVGTVIDSAGEPLAGAEIYAGGWDDGSAWLISDRQVADSRGHFALEGLGRKIQLQISAPDHVGINWVLRGLPDGLHWAEVRNWTGHASELQGPLKELRVTLKSVAWIEGRVTDAVTGRPVHLDRIVRCFFDRKPNGEVVLNGCQSPQFEQDANGTFRVPYQSPDEFHLTFSASGYQNAEAFTPLVTRLRRVTGINVRMHKLKQSSSLEVGIQTLSGIATRHGRPIPSGWVALTRLPGAPDKVNVAMCRGRTVTRPLHVYATAVIRGGRYTLDVPYQRDDWWVEMREPGGRITEAGTVAVALHEAKRLDIAAIPGGGIRGQVAGIPRQWANDTWVVAFTRTGLRFQTPVGPDGRFSFDRLPPGEYGLKAGYDAFEDAELPPQVLADDDPIYGSPAAPWKRAVLAKVASDHVVSGVRIELPVK